MAHPYNFTSDKEYSNYLRCLRSIRVGDSVRCYCRGSSIISAPSYNGAPSDISDLLEVVAVGDNEPDDHSTRGEKNICVSYKGATKLTFWDRGNIHLYNSIPATKEYLANYDRFYFLYANCHRIAQIIKRPWKND